MKKIPSKVLPQVSPKKNDLLSGMIWVVGFAVVALYIIQVCTKLMGIEQATAINVLQGVFFFSVSIVCLFAFNFH